MEGLAEGRRSAPCHVACKNERMVAGEGKKHFFLRKGFPSARGALDLVTAFFSCISAAFGLSRGEKQAKGAVSRGFQASLPCAQSFLCHIPRGSIRATRHHPIYEAGVGDNSGGPTPTPTPI